MCYLLLLDWCPRLWLVLGKKEKMWLLCYILFGHERRNVKKGGIGLVELHSPKER